MPQQALRPALTVLLAAVLFATSGCAINPEISLSDITTGDKRPVVLSVPFFPQLEYQCGPAALSGILTKSGIETNPDEIAGMIYLPEKRGSLQVELLAATRRMGRIPYVLDTDPKNLLMQLEAGYPALVLQNLRTPGFPAWHYAVIIGFDPAVNRIYLNSGADEQLTMGAPEFFRTWDWAERWAMVALRPGEMPAGAEPERYIRSVSQFQEIAGTADALPAWQAALDRWPQNSWPYLEMGNQAYHEGRLLEASKLYRTGLALDEHNIALANNLASLLGELGCPRLGETILQASATDLENEPQWKPIVAQTLSELAMLKDGDCTEEFLSTDTPATFESTDHP